MQHRGGFLGVAERAGHIRAVGANAVILTPSYATAKGACALGACGLHSNGAASPCPGCASGARRQAALL